LFDETIQLQQNRKAKKPQTNGRAFQQRKELYDLSAESSLPAGFNNKRDPVKAGVGVSSRNFKKAVQRNRIRRLLREAYRTEKIPLYHQLENTGGHLNLFLLYIGKEMPEYVLLKEKMRLIIQRLIKELSETVS
jgi:ribonuclease P protein component